MLPALQQQLDAELIASGLTEPVFVTNAPGDDSRLFVVDHWDGIHVIENGVLLPQMFLNMISIRWHDGNERGVNGMVFHPDYQQNGYFYVNYCDLNGDIVVSRLEVDPQNPNRADRHSAVTILSIPHPSQFHYGGWMEFDADGYLVISVGDGSDLGDPQGHGQDMSVLLGKIIRIDVDNPAGGLAYGIPATNPFLGNPLVREEILHSGFRNPWRCDIDDLTGDLWVGDVGNYLWEEIDFLAAGQEGQNCGWNTMEGRHCFQAGVCNQVGLTLPVYEYAHQYSQAPIRCAVTGGEVYRGRKMATMQGRFLFADWCSGEIWSMRTNGTIPLDVRLHDELDSILGNRAITGFGHDGDGELYLCSGIGGVIWKIVPAGMVLEIPQLEAGIPSSVSVVGATPNTPIAITYSSTGMGRTTYPIGVTFDLHRPSVLAELAADAQGEVLHAITPPVSAAGRTSWWQAGQLGGTSNVVVVTVD